MPVICRRCLLEQMEKEQPLYRLLQEWIEAIPEHQKAPQEVYAKRLDACKACAQLANGMCQLCGCYVELRAAKTHQRCPNSSPKWENTTPNTFA